MNFTIKNIEPKIGFYLAGFTDAEGCFCVSFSPKKNKNIPWNIHPIFCVDQKEKHIIAQFKKHLKCGTVSTNEKTGVSRYIVTSLFSLRNHIVPFFKKFGFQSAKKKRDFSNFIQVLDILEKNPILTKTNIEQILTLRINSEAIVANRKYSDEIIRSSLVEKNTIKKIKESSETNTPNSKIIETNDNEMIESDLYGDIKAEKALKVYIAGFADGNGSFNVSFRKRDDYKIGWKINPSFSISQKDKILLHLFQKTLNCGTIRKGVSKDIFYLEVLKLDDLRNKIVPFFRKYPILSQYGKNRFEKFYQTLDILNTDTLSRNNIEQILKLNRSENKKTKYTIDQILKRFDEFTSNK